MALPGKPKKCSSCGSANLSEAEKLERLLENQDDGVQSGMGHLEQDIVPWVVSWSDAEFQFQTDGVPSGLDDSGVKFSAIAFHW